MKRATRIGLALFVVLAVLSSMALAALLVAAVAHDGLQIVINGETFHLPELNAGHWLAASGGVLVAGLVMLLVLPLAALLGVGLPLLVVALVMAAALGTVSLVMAVLLSPLLLVGWLLWRGLGTRSAPRDPRGASEPAAARESGATIAR